MATPFLVCGSFILGELTRESPLIYAIFEAQTKFQCGFVYFLEQY